MGLKEVVVLRNSIKNNDLILYLVETGRHSGLFNM